jgi:hypothetical protein
MKAKKKDKKSNNSNSKKKTLKSRRKKEAVRRADKNCSKKESDDLLKAAAMENHERPIHTAATNKVLREIGERERNSSSRPGFTATVISKAKEKGELLYTNTPSNQGHPHLSPPPSRGEAFSYEGF